MKKYLLFLSISILFSCTKIHEDFNSADESSKSKLIKEEPYFSEVASIDLGNAGAAEISSYDPASKRLFVVNNSSGSNRIDVVDISDPSKPILVDVIQLSAYGGFVNSVSAYDGKIAAAIEAINKTDNGKVVIFNSFTLEEIANVSVGSLPDMVTFTPNGKYILTADEGEPNSSYTIDPIGTVSIIDVQDNYTVSKLDFASFSSQAESLKERGLRIFGPNASFEQDIEPEYIAVSANSQKAWVSLQENNGIARIDISSKHIEAIIPLGFKDYSLFENAMDLSDQDGGFKFSPWPVKGIFQPDGLAVIPVNDVPFIYSANEGDARDYSGFAELSRINNASIKLDPKIFPNYLDLKKNNQLGRLNITKMLGDKDSDGFYDELYSIGARSFSIWHGQSGQLLFDSQNELDQKCVELGIYPDSRSDDKGSEPESITIGRVGNRNILFVGMERSDAVFVYELSNPTKPVFLQHLITGDAPEGLLFVDASKSPNGSSLLIVSSEDDGTVKIYSSLNNVTSVY